MKYLYNFIIFLFGIVLRILALFNQKIGLFVKGRKDTFSKLKAAIGPDDRTIWIHCASLGEFEQGRPIIEQIRKRLPKFKIVLSFYSPSGYEVQKDYEPADVVVYLPVDTAANARNFIDSVHPSLAIFVKYEFWPNLLKELKKKEVDTILVSGIFRKNHIFFKSYGQWMKKSLQTFSHFFVQNQDSKNLLSGIGLSNVTVSGDTRFDRVAQILNQDNTLDFLDEFTKNKDILVAGSTWPVDESYLVNFINMNSDKNFRYIIAPHNINPREIEKLKKALQVNVSLYSEGKIKKDTAVFIVDTVGILTKIYHYASVAYVGGGFDKEGVHNVLEPAVFGTPIVIGPIYDKFEEAKELVSRKGCLVAKNEAELKDHFTVLMQNKKSRTDVGQINESYIKEQLGATNIILDFIEDQLRDIS